MKSYVGKSQFRETTKKKRFDAQNIAIKFNIYYPEKN